MLQASERDGVVFWRVSEPVRPGQASLRLANALVDACADLEQREVLPVGVVLTSGGASFWLQSPAQAADCDALGPSWAEATTQLGRLSPPTIAVLAGEAIGPAWELALACDLRLAANGARVGSPELRWGRLPAAGGTQRLTRLAGPATALRLLLLGELLDAPAALELRLLHRVAPAAELDDCLEALLAGLRTSAPIALAYAKETVHRAVDLPLESGLRLEADLATLLQTTADRAEGIGAFLERRSPDFQGR
jgi:enoyl-CoA hydratase